MNHRYVLYSNTQGVYLGNFMGLGFWSKLDPAGQDSAPTFRSESEAGSHMATWDTPVLDARLVPVVEDIIEPEYASVAQCVAAGLPAWDLDPPTGDFPPVPTVPDEETSRP